MPVTVSDWSGLYNVVLTVLAVKPVGQSETVCLSGQSVSTVATDGPDWPAGCLHLLYRLDWSSVLVHTGTDTDTPE